MGTLNVVGIGPGNDLHITPAALSAIKSSDHVIGYTTYLRLIKNHIVGKEITRTGMSEEIDRAMTAIKLAKEGKTVTLVSSGDAGVYGMVGLVFDCLKEMKWKRGDDPTLNIIPGISAANSCGSLVGAPLIHDSCTISLSDLLTPWSVIEKRIESASKGDFVISFYNPASGRRQRQIVEAKKIITKYRPGNTPVALVKSGYRKRQDIVMTDLDNFLDYEIGMLTTVIVGSSQTYMYEGYMVTPRGHENKYDLASGDVKKGQRKTFSLKCEGDLKSQVDLKEEGLELAKTYVTPTDSWVTPKDVNDKTFLNDSSEDSALEALEMLQGSGHLQFEETKVEEKEVRNILETKDLSTLGLFHGVLWFEDKKDTYLIGDFKEPVSLEEHGLSIIEETGSVKKIKGTSKVQPLFLWEGKGLDAASDIYKKLIIYRNDSVSMRLQDVLKESSEKVAFNGDALFDTRWLANMPQNVWDCVRETKLKC